MVIILFQGISAVIPYLCLLSTSLFLSCVVSNTSIAGKPFLDSLWALEIIGIKDPLTPNNDDEALYRFYESIKFNVGRYHIAWTWKQHNICLLDNYLLALKQIKLLMNHHQLNSELLQKYNNIINSLTVRFSNANVHVSQTHFTDKPYHIHL